MNRKGSLVFCLLTCLGLLLPGCQKTSPQNSTSTAVSDSASTSVVSTSAKPTAVTITLSADVPSRILLGRKLDLAKYVTLTGADSFTLFSTSKNITIDGTTIKAKAIGDFSVNIIAGSGLAGYAGKVVTSDEADLAYFVDTIGDTYDACLKKSSTVQIEVFHNSRYAKWGYSYASGNPEGYAAAIGPFDDHYYWVAEDKDSTKATVNPGYQYSAEQCGYGGKIKLSGADIVDTEDGKIALTKEAKIKAFLGNAVSANVSGISEIDFSLNEAGSVLTGDIVANGTSTGYTIEISQVGTWSDPVLDAFYEEGGFTAPAVVAMQGYKSSALTDAVTSMITSKEYCEDILVYWSGDPGKDALAALPAEQVHYWVKGDNSFVSHTMDMSKAIDFTSYNKGTDGKFYKSTGTRAPRSDDSGTWNWTIKTKEESEKGPWELPEATIVNLTADSINGLNVTSGFAQDNSSVSGPSINTNFMSFYDTNALGDQGAFYEKYLRSYGLGTDLLGKVKAFAATYYPDENWYDAFTMTVMQQRRKVEVSGNVYYDATVVSFALSLRQLYNGCNWGVTASIGIDSSRPSYDKWCKGLQEVIDVA